jgi:hypothetical protein
MQTQTQSQLDALMRAKALARWEGEGGALAPSPEKDSIDDVSLRLLARLGAALLDSWDDLPPGVQGDIVRRARTIGTTDHHARVMANLAGFINRYKSEC